MTEIENKVGRKRKLIDISSRVMKTSGSVENVPEELRDKAAEVIAGLMLLKIGIDPDKNKELLWKNKELLRKTIGKTKITVKLSEIPNELIGKAAEWLVQLRSLEFGIDSNRHSELPHTDIDAYRPHGLFGPRIATPVQVKSCSLRKHGYAIRIDDQPLREFRGWYIAVLEREPWDDFLYIPDDDMKELMEKYGRQPEKTRTARRHHKNRWYLKVYRHWDLLKRYLDSSKFVEAVLRARINF